MSAADALRAIDAWLDDLTSSDLDYIEYGEEARAND